MWDKTSHMEDDDWTGLPTVLDHYYKPIDDGSGDDDG
jgi:hypothetical protein